MGKTMGMSKKLLVVSILYPAAKAPLDVYFYFFTYLLWKMGGSLAGLLAIGYVWVLPLVVIVGAMAWTWKDRDFRWLSVIVFVTWVAGIALAETFLWAFFLFGNFDFGVDC
jgi:hypothetical protein